MDMTWLSVSAKCPDCKSDCVLQSADFSADSEWRFFFWCVKCNESMQWRVFQSQLAQQAMANDIEKLLAKRSLVAVDKAIGKRDSPNNWTRPAAATAQAQPDRAGHPRPQGPEDSHPAGRIAGATVQWWGYPIRLVRRVCTLEMNDYWWCETLYTPEPETMMVSFRP